MFCQECGRQVDDQEMFCIYCGVRLEKVRKDKANEYEKSFNLILFDKLLIIIAIATWIWGGITAYNQENPAYLIVGIWSEEKYDEEVDYDNLLITYKNGTFIRDGERGTYEFLKEKLVFHYDGEGNHFFEEFIYDFKNSGNELQLKESDDSYEEAVTFVRIDPEHEEVADY